MSKEFRLPLDYKEKVGRAVHDIPQVKRTTALPGLLLPLYARRMKRGESFIFGTPLMLLQSLPTLAPVLGGWRLRIEWYFNSDANHYGWIDNNSRLTPQELLDRKHHTFRPAMESCEELHERFTELYESYVTQDELPHSYGGFVRKFGIGRGSLADYMGIAPGTIIQSHSEDKCDVRNDFNIDFILTYLNIVRCYHSNHQFPDVPYIDNPFTISDSSTITYNPGEVFRTFSVDDLDNLFMFLRYCENGVDFRPYGYTPNTNVPGIYVPGSDLDSHVISSTSSVINDPVPARYRVAVSKFLEYLQSVSKEGCGLFCCQYMPDLYRNLLNNDANLLKSVVEVTQQADGSEGFSIETFRFQNRLQLIFDRIQPFGGKDSTISRTRWGVKSHREYDIPELVNVHTEFINTTAVTSNNAGTATRGGESITTVPGDLSGYTNERKFSKHKQKFTANTPGTLMAIVTLVPQVDYCQNVEAHLSSFDFESEFSPQMAQRGFESVPVARYFSLPTGRILWAVNTFDDPTDNVLSYFEMNNQSDVVMGKQVAWLEDIASVNRVHGEFVTFGDLDYWVLGRNFAKLYDHVHDGGTEEPSERLVGAEWNISPYVDPTDWQFMFTAQTIKDPNWYLQVMFDVTDISPVGYRFMPTLE